MTSCRSIYQPKTDKQRTRLDASWQRHIYLDQIKTWKENAWHVKSYVLSQWQNCEVNQLPLPWHGGRQTLSCGQMIFLTSRIAKQTLYGKVAEKNFTYPRIRQLFQLMGASVCSLASSITQAISYASCLPLFPYRSTHAEWNMDVSKTQTNTGTTDGHQNH